MVQHLVAGVTQALDRRRVVRLRDVHRVVDVNAAATAAEAQLWPPEADTGLVAGHDPQRAAALGPALDNGKAEQAGVEALAGLEVVHLERELGNAGHRDGGILSQLKASCAHCRS